MGFKTPNFPPVDPATFGQQPRMERLRQLALHWVDYGFGTPKIVHTIYIAKLVFIHGVLGVFLAWVTSDIGSLGDIASWWREPIFYQKLVLWTVFLEALGIAGAWGILCGHFKPQTGAFKYWLKPGTIRLNPFKWVPGTNGDSRTAFDVFLYAGILITAVLCVVLPGAHNGELVDTFAKYGWSTHGTLISPVLLIIMMAFLVVAGLRDKTLFLAARGEQYMPVMFFSVVFGTVDMIVALKLLIVVVWVGAAISKLGYHFSNVVSPMFSNAPVVVSKSFKRKMYRNYPNDLRPSHLTSFFAHVGGSLLECGGALVLLFSTNRTVTIIAIIAMLTFHLVIIVMFALAAPNEWNLLFGFTTATLFWNFPAEKGFGIGDMSSWWVTLLVIGGLLFFPILGNLVPDKVSFLPSMRQYAGNWASAQWAFAPGAEAKIDEFIVKDSPQQIKQLEATYPTPVAEIVLDQTLAWRSMHSQGRALFSLTMRHLGDKWESYSIREAEFANNAVIGWNFGDGHLHREDLVAAIQKRCNFAPGEFVVAWIESQAIHSKVQHYRIIDAALGVVERGTYRVKDAVNAQPWLPDGPIPVNVEWTRS